MQIALLQLIVSFFRFKGLGLDEKKKEFTLYALHYQVVIPYYYNAM